MNCNFCGKSQNEVDKIIAGPTSYICNQCIEACTKILTEEKAAAGKLDGVIEAVREDLLQRSRIGIKKYGVTLERGIGDKSLGDWLQHAYEETLDQANYLKCAILECERLKTQIKVEVP